MAPSELTGQPFAPVDPNATAVHEAIPAQGLTLMRITMATPPDRRPPQVPPAVLADRVARANRLYHAAGYGTVAAGLPCRPACTQPRDVRGLALPAVTAAEVPRSPRPLGEWFKAPLGHQQRPQLIWGFSVSLAVA